MKKILFSLLVMAGITATAQVKVGNNPTTLATDANFQVEGTATTNQFIVLKNGNVGIGTTAPVSKLDVLGGSFIGNQITAAVESLDTNILNVISPTKSTTIAVTPPETALRLIKAGTLGVKFNATADFQIGTYAAGFTSFSSLNFRLANGGTQIPEVDVMTLLSNGNVGIGTTTPNASLQFANTLANRKIVLNELVSNDHNYFGFGYNTGILRYQIASTFDKHIFYAGASVSTSNELMTIDGNGKVGIGTTTPVTALTLGANSTGISFLGVGTSFNGGRLGGINAYRLDDGNGGLTFETFAGGSGGSEKMRITNTGNVVIGTGTTTPLSLLSLKASNPELGFYSLTSNLNNGKTSIIKSITENDGNGHLAFETYAGSFGGGERMRITNRGNVGIGTGTTTPTSILQVIGIPAFASDAAAGTAGLTAGAFWSTAGHATLPNGVLMVKL